MTKANDIDTMLKKLLQKNEKVIKATTPSNPTIESDDEWRQETHWDELYERLATK